MNIESREWIPGMAPGNDIFRALTRAYFKGFEGEIPYAHALRIFCSCARRHAHAREQPALTPGNDGALTRAYFKRFEGEIPYTHARRLFCACARRNARVGEQCAH